MPASAGMTRNPGQLCACAGMTKKAERRLDIFYIHKSFIQVPT